MASKVEICNRALLRVGASTITSLDDDTIRAKHCKKIFDLVAEGVMSQGPWTNTLQRVALAKLSTAPAFGYDSQFQLPTNPKCLKVIAINDVTPGDYDYAIEDNKLLISLNAVSLLYVGYISNSGNYGTYLTESITDALAAELAYPLSGIATLASELRKLYLANLGGNLALDNQQGTHDRIVTRDLIENR